MSLTIKWYALARPGWTMLQGRPGNVGEGDDLAPTSGVCATCVEVVLDSIRDTFPPPWTVQHCWVPLILVWPADPVQVKINDADDTNWQQATRGRGN